MRPPLLGSLPRVPLFGNKNNGGYIIFMDKYSRSKTTHLNVITILLMKP